ncbi:MAG TPA: hypothetical protein VKQ32_00370 [Polyangia bacterium]|nr:hypothetical protein [Polyangia bacterium]
MRARLALAFVCALPMAACTNFANPSLVVDLRVLAVDVEPSEVILDADLTDPSMPVVANNPPITVTPLIIDPAGGGRTVTYTISACPNNPFAPAPAGSGMGPAGFPSGGARTTVGSALCDENSPTTWLLTSGAVPNGTSVTVQPTVEQLTVAFMTDIFPDQFGNLHGGFDLGMPLTLDIKVDAGTEEIRAVKRVLYWAQRIDAAQMPNQTPRIDSLTAFARDDATLQPVGPQETLPPDVPLAFDQGVSQRWILPSPGDAEQYETTIIDPDTHKAVPFTVARETLRYHFYTDLATFSPFVTSTEPPPGFVVTDHVHIESDFVANFGTLMTDANGHALATIWVVVSDDRGGESWITRQVQLTP